jgi:hypothetical protein
MGTVGTAGARAQNLEPPAGEVELSFQLAGAGVQRYVCKGKEGGGGFEWVLQEPEAKLYDGAHHEVGSHSAGPTWAMKDGSKVVRKRQVASADSPTPGAIPWLLLEVEPSGSGMLARVRWVKRTGTVGGRAPAGPPGSADACEAARAGATRDVPYKATYVFYIAKPAPKSP